jgi:hypothetical protein
VLGNTTTLCDASKGVNGDPLVCYILLLWMFHGMVSNIGVSTFIRPYFSILRINIHEVFLKQPPYTFVWYHWPSTRNMSTIIMFCIDICHSSMLKYL